MQFRKITKLSANFCESLRENPRYQNSRYRGLERENQKQVHGTRTFSHPLKHPPTSHTCAHVCICFFLFLFFFSFSRTTLCTLKRLLDRKPGPSFTLNPMKRTDLPSLSFSATLSHPPPFTRAFSLFLSLAQTIES